MSEDIADDVAPAAVLAAGPHRIDLADDGLVLRLYLPADVPMLVQAFTDPVTRTWNPGPTDPEELEAWVGSRNDWSDGTHASWAVADHEDLLVGAVSLHHLDLEQGDVEVGYWTAPWGRGRGVASAAVRAVSAFAHERLGCHRVHLFHAVENIGSCGVARRAGFALEGTLRQSYRYPDGVHHDEHLHARIAGDPWPSRQ
ncbi:GNAT family N-acetyltransferase [Nocardioides bruguierae]|uniref:GNAT family N-acetyltransferase n=1 Tax=Nocardioides bruguierae TaxID=2945102 RepID=A0A9X2IEM4_9ACTN|nr:GNAT family N-acetyltransferase [Nocardioides bruguierae]MCM0620452.1 GNAT family N-acetyltransferase [Nocardioides bruguierae]